MRVAVTQPNFLPWLGYFDLLDQVDLWVSLDNVQLTRRSFIVRNRIKLADDRPRWLSVSLKKVAQDCEIRAAELAPGAWARSLGQVLRENYRKARYSDQLDELCELLEPVSGDQNLARYNERILLRLAQMLGLRFQIARASELEPELSGTAEEKIFSLLSHFDVTHFYNFRRGIEMGLYDPKSFARRGIRLLKHDYQHPEYRQLGQTFEPQLSIVDLLLNEGPRAAEIVRSGSRWMEMTS